MLNDQTNRVPTDDHRKALTSSTAITINANKHFTSQDRDRAESDLREHSSD